MIAEQTAHYHAELISLEIEEMEYLLASIIMIIQLIVNGFLAASARCWGRITSHIVSRLMRPQTKIAFCCYKVGMSGKTWHFTAALQKIQFQRESWVGQ